MKNIVEHYKIRCTLVYVDPYYTAPVKKYWINYETIVKKHMVGVYLASILSDGGQLAPHLVSMILHLVVSRS